MAKKVLLVLLLASVLAGGVWAQDWGGKKNFASADVGIVVGGARYERLLTPQLSVGADVYWANSFILFNELEIGVFARYYLWKGLFGELGLGYHTHSGMEDTGVSLFGVPVTTFVVTQGVAISPGLGWKFDPGNAGGFFVEPGIIVPITIGKDDYSEDSNTAVGFVLYCGLGWAF